MKFFVYTLYTTPTRAPLVAKASAVNALPAREALQALFIMGEDMWLKLPSATSADPFKVRAYMWVDELRQAEAWARAGVEDFGLVALRAKGEKAVERMVQQTITDAKAARSRDS